MVELAQQNKDIYAVTAAMIEGTGYGKFAQNYPDRLVDVGIAEGHAVTMSAGLALSGKKPYVAIYSTFLQRAYDNVLHDVCLNKLPVVFCIDRAGFVGGDGETHQGIYDVAYLGATSDMSIFAPKDGKELADALIWAQDFDRPFAIRYPKCEIAKEYDFHTDIEYGKWEKLIDNNSDIVLISNGDVLSNVMTATDILKNKGISVDVINARFVAPYDVEMIETLRGKTLIFFEEYVEQNSIYSRVLAYLNKKGDVETKIYGVNIPNAAYAVASRGELLRSVGLDSQSIASYVESKINK